MNYIPALQQMAALAFHCGGNEERRANAQMNNFRAATTKRIITDCFKPRHKKYHNLCGYKQNLFVTFGV